MKNKIKEYILITIGMVIVAFGMYFFLMSQNLVVGGANGLGIVINHWFPLISIGTLMIIINIVLFIVAFIVIGPSFGVKTIYASLGTSIIVSLLGRFVPIHEPFSNDILLQLIFGVLISGVGMGIVFNQNASTGGTDILAKIINKFFGIGIGKAVLISDVAITLGALFTFGAELGMYSLLGIIINSFVIDSTIEGINLAKEVNIVSKYSEEIKLYIVNELDRGATIYFAEGAYTGEKKNVIVTVLDIRDFIKLRNYIKGIDRDAFVRVSNVYEVLGDGFSNINA